MSRLTRRRRGMALLLMLMALAGACLRLSEPVESPPPAELPQLTPPAPTETPSPYGWTDEMTVMSGICFEAALDASGQVFVLRSAEAHIRFYDLADNSHLCRRPVRRQPFDFNGGRVLAGLWSYGMGCKARHDVLAVNRDDTAKTLTIQLRFVSEGDCPYELIRPFWIGLDDAADYAINIEVS